MKINKNSLVDQIKNLSLDTNIHPNVILKYYFFDCFLSRVVKSRYIDNLVFKGGFLLTHIFGIRSRTTEDIDISLKNLKLSQDSILLIISNIISIECQDNVLFEIRSIGPIRKDDKYGGFRVKLIGHLENIKEPFYIDIATGDVITPCAIDYRYHCLFTNNEINIKGYNVETIISEKLHAVLSRGINNGRAKDFYDLYVFSKLKFDSINVVYLRDAFFNTCKHRDIIFKEEDVKIILENVSSNVSMGNSWQRFAKTKSYAANITFLETVEQTKKLLNIIYLKQY
ncbi:MAG: nucleotidyl transferase AbiEii/AbiGii toxin family protein [Bacilli bacterium]|nr:nucleotidyl transferase AbiEii/AbiGii toxin family protein [Bacilli bacterium]